MNHCAILHKKTFISSEFLSSPYFSMKCIKSDDTFYELCIKSANAVGYFCIKTGNAFTFSRRISKH